MLAAFIAACCAAKGVPLREPRKPSEPDDFQESTLPCWSVMVTIVLLNDAWMCAIPNGTFLRSLRLNCFFPPPLPLAAAFFASAMFAYPLAVFFFWATVP